MISYNQLIALIESFASNHLQIKRFGAEFKEQLPNLSTDGVSFPYLFMVPIGTVTGEFVKEIEVEIYCIDRLRKDRENTNDIVSDTEQILTDLGVWLEDGQTSVDVVRSYSAIPINNDTLDFVAGWSQRYKFELERIAECEIPMTDATSGIGCADASYLVEYENGTEIQSGTIESGSSVTVVVPNPTECDDATVNVNKSDGTLISAVTVASGDTEPYNVADSTAVLKDTDGNTLSTTSIKATESANIEAPDSIVNINSVLWDNVLSGDTEDISVRQSSGATEVGSKQGVHWRIADSDITLNSGAFLSVKAEDSQDIELVDQTDTTITPLSVVGNKITVDIPSGGGFTDMKLLPRDLLTNYGTGDQPTRGRATDFFTLNYTNEWGHAFRFVGQTGGYTDGTSYFDVSGVATTKALAFPNSIIYDFTSRNETEILSYYIGDSTTYRSYNTALPLHVSSTFGGLTAWYLWNDFEVRNVMSLGSFDSLGHWMSHKPFEFNSSTRYFITSTRSGINITRLDLRSLAYIQATSLTNASLQVYVRYTTLTEMGL
jgi:hypothetical protein